MLGGCCSSDNRGLQSQARRSFKLTKLTQMFTDGLLISYSLRAQNTSRVLFKYAKSVAEVSINE
jgi:hypothetical protein